MLPVAGDARGDGEGHPLVLPSEIGAQQNRHEHEPGRRDDGEHDQLQVKRTRPRATGALLHQPVEPRTTTSEPARSRSGAG